MSRISLVAADPDEGYIDSLSSFFRSLCPMKLNIHVFTKKEALCDYLSGNGNKTDILLVDPDLLPEEVQKYGIGLIVLLCRTASPDEKTAQPCIGKYQPGDEILNRILELHAASGRQVQNPLKLPQKVSTISVFSPQGGSGKSTVSLYLSRQFSEMGLKVLYLNFESINSTGFFIPQWDGKAGGMSSLLYYLKENRKNLAVKINNIKSLDSRLGIQYFKPAFSSLEIDEITAEDMERLLFELKDTGQFHILVVDTESSVSQRNMALLENSECIVFPIIQDSMAKYKLELFQKDIGKIYPEDGSKILGKILPLINKYTPDPSWRDMSLDGAPVAYKIPYVDDMVLSRAGSPVFNPDSVVNTYMGELARHIREKLSIAVMEGRHE
ncbi:MAG: AAA family ATPase [Clostridiales bacterium]|jgi:cellulose biosynthesis protein BcsQ|nr:AAA family ATPase [Eubacteriales bacterium]MDH7566298.1 AAA family ATPase [Clostridiales bacterium]